MPGYSGRPTAIRSTRIAGFGHYTPERRVENSVIEQDLGLSPGWIERRTGIRARRWAAADEALTDIAFKAAMTALDRSSVRLDDVGLVLLATSTPDHLLPPSAPLLAHKVGLSCGAVDLTGACAGFLYAFLFADGFVKSTGKAVLVVAANILSRRINHTEVASAVLFADAAAALILVPSEHEKAGILGSHVYSDGGFYDQIVIAGGGTRSLQSNSMPSEDRFIKIKDGQLVFERAVKSMTKSSLLAMQQAGIDAARLNYFIPHQANARIFNLVAQSLEFDPAITLRSIEEFGNSSAATIPLTMSIADQEHKFADGQLLLMTAIGAGFTGGAVVFRTADR